MNKTPHKQCAEEILIALQMSYPLNYKVVALTESILTKHFPQPTSTSSLDEVVEKCHSDIFDTSFLRVSNKERIKQAILEYNASLLAEVERLKANVLQEERSCFHLINQRDIAENAADTISSILLNEPIDWSDHQSKWKEAEDLAGDFNNLRTQLSTADRTGYERGVKEAASMLTHCGNADCGNAWCKGSREVKQAILNLLNKKD